MAYGGQVDGRKSSLRQRPYHVEHTGSRPITEVKQRRAWLVLGWVTAWENRVLLASLFPLPTFFFLFILFLLILPIYPSLLHSRPSSSNLYELKKKNKNKICTRTKIISVLTRILLRLPTMTISLFTYFFLFFKNSYNHSHA